MIDTQRWQHLRAAAADAQFDGPSFVQVQEANGRRARARDELARFKAAGPQGHPSGPPTARAHPGDRVLPGVGGRSHDDIARSFESGVRELESRVTTAEHEADRLAERLRECSERRTALTRLIDAIRTWANEQNVALPGDEGRIVPPLGIGGARSVHVPAAPAGSRDFLGRVT